MIQLKKVNKSFVDKSKYTTYALSDIDITFPETGLVCLTGKSGCGKTTLLNILSGLLSMDSGEYLIHEKNIKELSKTEWEAVRNEYYSIIFQNYNLIDYLSVYDNLTIAMQHLPLDTNYNDRIDQALNKIDMLSCKHKIVSDLSGGEKQRIAIIRSILKESKVILADEPTGSLDEENGKIVFELLKEIAKDRLVIVVTHDVDFAELYADYIIKLNYGKIIFNSLPNSVKRNNNQLYLTQENKLTFKKITSFKKTLNKKQIFRKSFTVLFFTLCMFFLMISFHLSFFQEKDYTYHAINSVSIEDNLISTQSTKISTDINTRSIDINTYGNLEFYPTYVNAFEFKTDFLFRTTMEQEIFRTCILTPLEDNQIIITDYQANMLKSLGILPYEHYSDLIGTTLDILGLSLMIQDVKTTTFEDNHGHQYDLKLLTEFDVVKMNENTFKKLVVRTNYRINGIENDTKIKVYRENILEKIESDHSYVGKKELDEHEVAVSIGALSIYTDYTSINDIDVIKSYLGTTISLNIQTGNTTITGEYKIACITRQDFHLVYFNNEVYDTIFQLEDININTVPYTYRVSLSNKKDSLKLLTDLEKEGLYLVNSISFDLASAISFITSTAVFFNAISIITLCMLVLMVFFFNKLTISHNKKNIGILSSLGIKNNWISLVYQLDNVILVFTSFVISFLGSLTSVIVVNKILKSDFEIRINIIQFNVLFTLLVLLITWSITSLLLILSFQKIKSKDILELLK